MYIPSQRSNDISSPSKPPSREKREVLSSGTADIKSLIQGPQGPPGSRGAIGPPVCV